MFFTEAAQPANSRRTSNRRKDQVQHGAGHGVNEKFLINQQEPFKSHYSGLGPLKLPLSAIQREFSLVPAVVFRPAQLEDRA